MDRRRVARLLVAAVVLSLTLAGAVTAVTGEGVRSLGPGTVTDRADGTTVVGVQGFHYRGQGSVKKPPRVLAATPTAETGWVLDGSGRASWYYDVDPLPDGDVLVTSITRRDTIVFRYDGANATVEWRERFEGTDRLEDTHDADLLSNGDIVVANMRNGRNDRVFVYNRSRDEIVWEWLFRNHYPNDTGPGIGSEDWTHVNDVEAVDGGEKFLVSPRNFDQVVLIDRSTKEIEWRLGADQNHEVLYAQHNPDLLYGPNGEPTLLVADSENDRIVEYARRDGEWVRTWTLTGGLKWPRDADRLPNGNTLVVDSLHHRVIEVTPTGRVVWEYNATWGPYDAERVGTGDESNGPTTAELNATGNYTVHGGAEGANARVGPAKWVAALFAGTPVGPAASEAANSWSHVAPWVKPVWLPPWAFAYLVVAGVVAVPWLVVEAWLARGRIAAVARSRA